MNDTFEIRGNVVFVVIGQHTIKRYEKNNIIVDVGKNLVRDLLNSGSGLAINKIAFGTGDTAAAASDTALVAQTFIKDITQKVVSTKQLLCKLFVTTSDVSGTFKEAGLFAGTKLFSRLVLDSPIVKASDETLYVEWEINF